MKIFMKISVKAVLSTAILGILLLAVSFAAIGAVYKHVDDHGKLIKYSDQPQKPGDKPVKMSKPAMVYESEKPVNTPATKRATTERKKMPKEAESTSVIAYVAVAIMKPENEEAIRANGGSFPIEVVSQPALDVKAGHRYVVVVDGEKRNKSSQTKITLENMDRGAHSISVEIRDKEDNVMVSSSSKNIYVLRAGRR